MNISIDDATEIAFVEKIMLDKYRNEPFHNLNLLYKNTVSTSISGGTCSDKTLSFIDSARKSGVDVALHSGFIGGKEIHRLAKVRINNKNYFADVGNGWPALKLYPSDLEVNFTCFGMRFRTEITSSQVNVYHERLGKEVLQLSINIQSRPEQDIRADIASRFSSGNVYPFSNSIRFSLVVGKRFLFLRGDRLEVYSDDKVEIIEGIQQSDIANIISHNFGFDIKNRFAIPD